MPTRCAWNYTYCLGLFQVEDVYFTVRKLRAGLRAYGERCAAGGRGEPAAWGACRWTVRSRCLVRRREAFARGRNGAIAALDKVLRAEL